MRKFDKIKNLGGQDVKKLGERPIYVAPKMMGFKKNGIAKVAYMENGELKKINSDDLDSKILIYERQVKGWFLNICSEMKNKPNTGFVTLMVSDVL